MYSVLTATDWLRFGGNLKGENAFRGESFTRLQVGLNKGKRCLLAAPVLEDLLRSSQLRQRAAERFFARRGLFTLKLEGEKKGNGADQPLHCRESYSRISWRDSSMAPASAASSPPPMAMAYRRGRLAFWLAYECRLSAHG